MKKTVYRLRDKISGEFLLVSTCIETYDDEPYVYYTLDYGYGDCVFETESAQKAEWVRQHKIYDGDNINYSATFDEPFHYYDIESLEVVKIDIVEYENSIEKVNIPTKLDIYTRKLQKDKGYALIIHDYVDYCRKHDINPDNDYSYDATDLEYYKNDILTEGAN
jgi:hypothetical protein